MKNITMKNALALLLLFFSLHAFTQLEVKEITGSTKEIYTDAAGHEIQMEIQKEDTAYVFLFRNAKYSKNKDLVQIEFENGAELTQFIELMSTALKSGKEYETKSYRIIQGSVNKSITVLTPDGHFYISTKWTEKMSARLKELELI